MATTFHLFSNLPAELRVRIWRIALEDDYTELNGRHRIIELHSYNPKLKKVAVAVSRRYPTLFEVNHEARYEAAKATGGEWIKVNARFDSSMKQLDHTTSVEIYINFSQDVIFLSDRFLSCNASGRMPWYNETQPDETNLQILVDVFPNSAVKKIAYLVLVADDAPDNGDNIEQFTALKRLHLHASKYTYHGIRARQALAVQVLKAWESRGAEVPLISYYPDSVHPDAKTLAWLLRTGVIDLPWDGIRTVEWGFRKDLWVPRAKKGSSTLQKIG